MLDGSELANGFFGRCERGTFPIERGILRGKFVFEARECGGIRPAVDGQVSIGTVVRAQQRAVCPH